MVNTSLDVSRCVLGGDVLGGWCHRGGVVGIVEMAVMEEVEVSSSSSLCPTTQRDGHGVCRRKHVVDVSRLW